MFGRQEPARPWRGRQGVKHPCHGGTEIVQQEWEVARPYFCNVCVCMCVFPGWQAFRRKEQAGGAEPPGAAATTLPRGSGVVLRPLPERSEPLLQAPPKPGFPRHPFFAWRVPSPAAIGWRCAPPSAPPPQGTVPSCPELRAAGGLLNRGGGSRGEGGARSDTSHRRPGLGEAGGQLKITSAAPTTAGPKVRRRRGARAPQQASGRRLSGGLSGVGLLCRGRRQRGEGRAEKTAGRTCGPGGRLAAPLPPKSSGLLDCGPGTGSRSREGVGPQPNLNG